MNSILSFETVGKARGLGSRVSIPGLHPLRAAGKKFIWFKLVFLITFLPVLLRANERTCPVQPAMQVPLTLDTASVHEARIALVDEGTYKITTTGSNPSVGVLLHGDIDANQVCILTFEYLSVNADNPVYAEFGSSAVETHALLAGGLSHSEAFSAYSTDLAKSPDWKGNIGIFRIRFDAAPGRVIRLRNIVLRSPIEVERTPASHIAHRRVEDHHLQSDLTAYLGRQYRQQITSVYVSNSTVHIEGKTNSNNEEFYLAEVPLYENITERHSFDYVTRLSPKDHYFRIELTRFRTLPNGRYDRLLSKWAIVRKSASGFELASHARYTDEVEPLWNSPDEQPRCKKGLSGISASSSLGDLDQLGVCSISVNIFLDYIHSQAKPGDISLSYNGQAYFADAKAVADYDLVMQFAAQRHIVVSAILLVPQALKFSDQAGGRLLAIPDADPAGVYSMPNVTTFEGLQLYASALNFLAKRYSRPDRKYGRIQNWFMHNEADKGWVWTNAGEKSEITYMDLYNKSMRTMYLIARQYNPHAKVFISLSHFWNRAAEDNSRFYPPRRLLSDLLSYSHAEGDYEWGIDYHLSSESLSKAPTWEDHNFTFSVDTPLIASRNVEVLNAWAQQPSTYFREIKRRSIFLTDRGLNSHDSWENSLTDRAAGLVYVWKKVGPLDAVEALQYRLGEKPIWSLYQKLGTTEEDKASAFALPVVGIKAWNEVLYRGTIRGAESQRAASRNLYSDTWVATDALGRTLPDYAEAGPPRPGRYVAMFYYLTHDSPGEPGPRNISTELSAEPDSSRWQRGRSYWGEPEAGYYLSSDKWIIRRHAELLSDAGVDVIVFSADNDLTFPEAYQTIAQVYAQMRAEGEQTPQIAFLASRKSIDQIWIDLYSKGLYKDLWFQWKGRPLLLMGQPKDMQRPEDLPQKIQDFFTIRESWAWDSLPWYRNGHDQWPWIAHYPQIYGWHESPWRPEAVSVSVAEHPLSAIGRSFHDGKEPPTDRYDLTPDTPRGVFFQDQWDRAIALDPELVFVTGWNEWTAPTVQAGADLENEMASWGFFPGAKFSRAGRQIYPGDLYFVDEYNEEFSRDIEPMKGGHTDNYYYELAANIRRYKGVHAQQPTSLPQTIDLAGDFAQWRGVTPEYRDHTGDTAHRNSPGNYQAGPYVDATGRNDIVAAKVARDDRNLYFYVQTRKSMTSSNDNAWMLLYIDTDQNSSTGWMGYDFIVNTHILNNRTTTLCPLAKDGSLGAPISIPFHSADNELMIAVPRALIKQDHGAVRLDFHWTDNIAPAIPSEFFLRGDSAPERRFNYRYKAPD